MLWGLMSCSCCTCSKSSNFYSGGISFILHSDSMGVEHAKQQVPACMHERVGFCDQNKWFDLPPAETFTSSISVLGHRGRRPWSHILISPESYLATSLYNPTAWAWSTTASMFRSVCVEMIFNCNIPCNAIALGVTEPPFKIMYSLPNRLCFRSISPRALHVLAFLKSNDASVGMYALLGSFFLFFWFSSPRPLVLKAWKTQLFFT